MASVVGDVEGALPRRLPDDEALRNVSTLRRGRVPIGSLRKIAYALKYREVNFAGVRQQRVADLDH